MLPFSLPVIPKLTFTSLIDIRWVPEQEIHVAYLPSADAQRARRLAGDRIPGGGAASAQGSAWYQRGWAIVDTDLAIGPPATPAWWGGRGRGRKRKAAVAGSPRLPSDRPPEGRDGAPISQGHAHQRRAATKLWRPLLLQIPTAPTA